MTKNRTKRIQNLIDEVNTYFRMTNMKDEHKSDLFMFICDMLLQKKMYRGYNFHKLAYDDNGNEWYPLAGSANPEEYNFVQIW